MFPGNIPVRVDTVRNAKTVPRTNPVTSLLFPSVQKFPLSVEYSIAVVMPLIVPVADSAEGCVAVQAGAAGLAARVML